MKLAIEGTIVMSDELRVTLDNMYDARLPEKWAKLSWQSTTLGFWYTELLERDGQFRRWCYHGRPKVCMSMSAMDGQGGRRSSFYYLTTDNELCTRGRELPHFVFALSETWTRDR